LLLLLSLPLPLLTASLYPVAQAFGGGVILW